MRLRERKSEKTVWGMPLWHIGRNARGFVAVGLNARGVIAVGLKAEGIVTLGMLSVGVLSLGMFRSACFLSDCLHLAFYLPAVFLSEYLRPGQSV